MTIKTNHITSGFSLATISPDNDIHIDFVTDQLLSMLEVSREAYLENPFIWSSRVSPSDYTDIMKGLEIAQTDGSRAYWEGIFTLSDGNRWYSTESIFTKGKDGSTTCESVIIDITGYKESEALRLEDYSIYEKILSKSSQGFWISSLDGRIIEVNESYCKMVGYSRQELIGMDIISLDIFYSPEEISNMIQELTHVGFLNFGTLHKDKNGKIIPVLVSSNYNSLIPDRIFTFFYDLRKQTDSTLIRNTIYDIEKATDRRINEAEALMINMSEQALQLIGQELHDNIGQILYAAFLQLSTLSEKLKTNSQEFSDEIDSIKQLIKKSIQGTRNVSNGLYPVGLDKAGLIPTIENFLQSMSTSKNISVNFHSELQVYSINAEMKLHIFRIIQESVSNSIRHGQATHIDISMGYSGDNLIIRITDDGVGIDHQAPTESLGLGLFTMRSRSNLINGTITIASLQPHGTEVVLTIKHTNPGKPLKTRRSTKATRAS